MGALQDGEYVSPPSGFTTGNVMCGFGRNSDFFGTVVEFQAYMNGRQVVSYSKDQAGVRSGGWANISAIFFRNV